MNKVVLFMGIAGLVIEGLSGCNGSIAESSQAADATVNQTIDAELLEVPDGILGLIIGKPKEPGTPRADGYPYQGSSFALWGGTASYPEAIPPGWSGSAPVTIINGEDSARTFHLSIESPVTKEGYYPFPEKYYSWIIIEDLQPKVPIGGSKKVLVTLFVPYDFPLELKGKSYIFGIKVEDWSQTGFVQIAPQMNWLINFE